MFGILGMNPFAKNYPGAFARGRLKAFWQTCFPLSQLDLLYLS